MKIVRHTARARFAAVGLVTVGDLVLAGCGAANENPAAGGETGGETVSGTIAGAGATSQASAQEAWITGFNAANPQAVISYGGGGSGAGRTQFIDGAVQFAGSDAYLNEEQLPLAQERCGGEVVELPLYISPIAVAFNLPGVDSLNLSPTTLASVFARTITTWNDPAIAADNAGVTLPATPITVVNRTDESGTTENFTEYLSAAAPDVWTFEPDGNWPAELAGGEGANGTQGVVSAITAGEGAIGYADASQVADLGTIAVGVGSAFQGPDAAAAAAVVAASPRVEGQGEYSFAVDLDRTSTEAGTYPIVLVSYILACTQYDDAAQAETVQAYLNYMASAEGQDAASANAGNAPISDEQRAQFQPGIDAIAAAAS